MQSSDDIHINAAYQIYGACINQAISDYRMGKRRDIISGRQEQDFEDAKRYLFDKNGLETSTLSYLVNLPLHKIRMSAKNPSLYVAYRNN